MEAFVLKYGCDLVVFVATIVTAMFFLARFSRKKCGAALGWKPWTAMAAIVAASIAVALIAESYEHRQLERTVSGLAPTYADEIFRMGHEKMSVDTPVDDP